MAAPDLPLDVTNPTTVVYLVLGTVAIAFYSWEKFSESTIKAEQDDFVSQLLPRYLATHEEYSRALFWYMASMIGLFFILSAIGPRLLPDLSKDLSKDLSNDAANAPLLVALLMVGVLPNVPLLQNLELGIRRFWHERAFIPGAARAIAETLRAANFDFSAYKSAAVLASPSLRGVASTDFEALRGSIEYMWARLSCLAHELERRRDAGETEMFDEEMLDRCSSDLDNITSKRRALEADIALYRQEKARDPFYDNNELRNAIISALKKLYVLLGCAVRLKTSPTADANAAFRSFGFVLGPSSRPRGNRDLIIVGLTAMTASLLILAFVALVASSGFGLWQASAYFLKKPQEPFIWSLSALLVHGVAIMTADWMRMRLLRKGRWFAIAGQERQPITANYIRVALCCAATGYAVMYLWGLILQPPTIDFAIGTAPFALLPAATGAFYGYHLDNVELGRRPSRLWEIGLQTLVTALCGLVAAPVWLALGGDVAGNADYIVLVTLFGAVVGASLASTIPPAAAARRCCSPLTEAQNSRIAMLRAAAEERFTSAELADQWLAQPHPALNNRSPKDAAADIDLCIKALGLLQGPRAVAA
jgi:hypothetical protein